MLLIDGVKYELWTPSTEDELEQIVKEHAQDVFGEQSIYLDMRQKLKSGVGTGSIPDGFVIVFGDSPHWRIVEVELSSHPLHDHIVAQVGRFISGIENPRTQNNIVNAIYDEITKDNFLKLRLQKSIGIVDIHRFLADLVSKLPILTIIIEKASLELSEALKILRYPQEIKVVEFQTFVREGAEAVHAHLFSPLREGKKESEEKEWNGETGKDKEKEGGRGRRVTFNELISAGLLRDEQVLYFYHTRPFTNERAQVIASSNQLKYEGDGRAYAISELAKILFPKYGFKEQEVQGPKYWKTEDGKLLHDLNEQIRKQRGDRT